MDFNYQRISLSSIGDEIQTYRISTQEDCLDLVASIKRVGLINCPILIPMGNDYRVISGFRRIRACRQLGWEYIDGRVVFADTTAVECAYLAIADNSLQRTLNWLEIARSFELLEKSGISPDKLSAEAVRFRLPHHPGIINKIRRITQLPEYIQNCIANETISVAMIQELADRSENEAVYLAELFEGLKLSLNKQRELISLADEIAYREDISVQDVLHAKRFQEILHDDRMDRAQKAQLIRSYLKQRRFPNIARTYENFTQRIQQFEMIGGIELTPPKNFEGCDYTFNLIFNNLSHLKKQIDFLNHLLSHPDLISLFSS